MDPTKGIINGNTLEELEYRRCTWWSNFLENISEREDGEVYDVNLITNKFDDDSSNDDADEAEEVQVLEDIEYHNLMNQSTQQEKTTFIMESEEMQDILNSTRPILKEHELRLKESGLDRVMNTFDSVRIKREVGGWMRRNHSSDSAKAEVQSTSDTDSSKSCEEDRYLRSVQKCHKRQPKHIQCFKKCKNYQASCCKHGMLVERKPHRSHDCNCCNYISVRNPKYWKMPSAEEAEIIDKRYGNLPLVSENKHKMRHCIRESSSSSASEYDFQERHLLKRNKTTESHTERKSKEKGFTTVAVDEYLLKNGSRNRTESMMENVYKTPTKSTALKISIPNTAPSKVTTKRRAAMKALSLLRTNKIRIVKSTKSKRVAKTQENEKIPSEYNTTFESDIKKAIALSLKILKQNRKDDPSEPQPSTSSGSTNNNTFQLGGSYRNKEVKGSASTAKTKKKAENRNKALSKAIKKQSRLKNFDQKTDEAKENTFLSNLENIYNSTALNSAAARKQLPSCLPAINGNLEWSPATPPWIENDSHTLRKKAASRLPAIKESSSSPSKAIPKMETQFKNVFSSTAIPGAAAAAVVGEELIISSPPIEEPVTPSKLTSKIRMRYATTEPRRKQKQNMVNNKTMGYHSNVSPTIGSAVKTKSNRIMLYTPQRKPCTKDEIFQVTEELMSSVVGEERARRFFKYHVGRLTFPKTSTVYYCPPEMELSSSESDDDPLQKAGSCGELYESEQQDDSNAV